jgi:rod shape determining protein RodA
LNEVFEIKPLLKKYHRDRIMAFIDADKAPKDLTHQSRQAAIAIGSAGLKGKGWGNGTQHTLGFLPRTAANNDFIFSVIAEEGGFLLAMGTVLVFLLMTLRLFVISYFCEDPFGRFLALGVGIFFLVHFLVNISVNIGLAPVTGLPLPFVSYGGSFILSCLCALGIGQSVSYFNYQE